MVDQYGPGRPTPEALARQQVAAQEQRRRGITADVPRPQYQGPTLADALSGAWDWTRGQLENVNWPTRESTAALEQPRTSGGFGGAPAGQVQQRHAVDPAEARRLSDIFGEMSLPQIFGPGRGQPQEQQGEQPSRPEGRSEQPRQETGGDERSDFQTALRRAISQGVPVEQVLPLAQTEEQRQQVQEAYGGGRPQGLTEEEMAAQPSLEQALGQQPITSRDELVEGTLLGAAMQPREQEPQERPGGGMSSFGELLEDPSFRQGLLQFGLNMLQPREPGMTTVGHGARSAQQGMEAMQQDRAQRAESERAQVEAAREERESRADVSATEALAEQRRARAAKLQQELSQQGMDPDRISASMADARVLARHAANRGRYESFDDALEDIYWQIQSTGMRDPDQWYADQVANLQSERAFMEDEEYQGMLSTLGELRDTMRQGQGRDPRQQRGQRGQREQQEQQVQPGSTVNVGGVEAEVVEVSPDGRQMLVRDPASGRERIVTRGE